MVSDNVVDYAKIGKRVKVARVERDWSQEDLSDRAGVSCSYLSNIENAHSKASLATFIKIANALDLGLDDLVCDSIKHGRAILNNQLVTLTRHCTDYEMHIIVETVKGLKGGLNNATDYVDRVESNYKHD